MTKETFSFGKRRGLRWRLRPAEQQKPAQPAAGTAIDVGGCLRRLREARSLTIRALAEKSGLAVNTLSLIENGKSSPSVSTLQQLAQALDAPITAFFETQAEVKRVAYVKANRRPRADFDQGFLEDLGAGDWNHPVEPFVLNLEPQAGSGPQDILHTGFEFVYCLAGQIAYTVDGFTYLLEPGDSLLFEAHLPHRWQNLCQQTARAILVLFPTDERDDPTKRHFASED